MKSEKTIKQYVTLLSWLVVIAALMRIGAVVISSPIIGVANNWDFTRVSGCIGLWQSDGKSKVDTINNDYPVRYFKYTGEKTPWVCLRTTEVLFPLIVTSWHDEGDIVDIREIGLLKVLFLGTAILTLLASIKNEVFKLAISIAFYITMGDVVIIPYFNSLYVDASALPSLFFSAAVLVWLFTMDRQPTRWQILGCITAFLWLAASKQQYSPLAAVFAGMSGLLIWIRWKNWRLITLMILSAVLALSTLSLINFSNKTMLHGAGMANSVNTFLGAVLPAAKDKPAALATLNLPLSCLPVIGQVWFTPGFQESLPCPEVTKVSRVRLLPLFFLQPEVFYTTMLKGLEYARPFYPRHLGIFEDRNFDSPLFRWVAHTSFSQLVAKMPVNIYRELSIVAMILGIISTAASFLLVLKPPERLSKALSVGTVLVGLGGVIVLYAIVSSVYGDGFSDFEKHAVGIIVGFGLQGCGIFFLIMNVISLFYRKFRPVKRSPDNSISKLTFE